YRSIELGGRSRGWDSPECGGRHCDGRGLAGACGGSGLSQRGGTMTAGLSEPAAAPLSAARGVAWSVRPGAGTRDQRPAVVPPFCRGLIVKHGTLVYASLVAARA